MSSLVEILLDAVVKGDETAVLHVLRLGADVNGRDLEGMSALHWAASSEDSDKLTFLLINLKSDINAIDKYGRTPLHYHAASGRVYGVTCLLHFGAKLNVTAADDQTPLQYALQHGQKEVIRLLTAYGGKSYSTDDKSIYSSPG